MRRIFQTLLIPVEIRANLTASGVDEDPGLGNMLVSTTLPS